VVIRPSITRLSKLPPLRPIDSFHWFRKCFSKFLIKFSVGLNAFKKIFKKLKKFKKNVKKRKNATKIKNKKFITSMFLIGSDVFLDGDDDWLGPSRPSVLETKNLS